MTVNTTPPPPPSSASKRPWIIAGSAAAAALILAGALIGVLVSGSDGDTAPSAPAGADPGVAQCLPLSRALQGGEVDEGDLSAAEAGFVRSRFQDIRDSGSAVIADLRGGRSGDGLDGHLIDLWTACGRHGAVVAPGYAGLAG